MRNEPTWRIPFGVIALLAALTAYGVVCARYLPELIGTWSALAQTPVYVILGIIWLLPIKRFLIWMETGNWKS